MVSGSVTSGSGRRPLSEEVKPVVEQGLRELARDFATHGPAYAERYIQYLVGERSTPPMPKGVHPQIAAAVRDVVTDSALVAGVKTARIR